MNPRFGYRSLPLALLAASLTFAAACADATPGAVGAISEAEPEVPAATDPPPAVEPVDRPVTVDPPPTVEPPAAIEPVPAEDIALVGMSDDQRRLFYLTDRTTLEDPHPGGPVHYRFWSLDLETGASTLVDERVVPFIEGGTTLAFSADGATVVYGRLPEAVDEMPKSEHWKYRVYAELQVWREGEGVVRALGTCRGKPLLATSGAHLAYERDTGELVIEGDPAGDAQSQAFEKGPYRAHSPTRSVVHFDGERLVATHLEDGSVATLAEDQARFLGIEGRWAVYAFEDRLAVYDLEERLVYLSEHLIAQHKSVTGFDLDPATGLAVAILGQGAYGELHVWDLATGEGYHIPAPTPRGAGGTQQVQDARVHDLGVAFYPRASWLDKDLWELREGTQHHVVKNVCQDASLPGTATRLVLTNEAGCATLHTDRGFFYDPGTMTLTDTGHDIRYLRAILEDQRIVFDRDHDEGLELVLWDLADDSLTTLAIEADYPLGVRRDGELFFARHGDGLIIVHPRGVSHAELADESRELDALIVSEDLVAYVLSGPEGASIQVASLDDLTDSSSFRRADRPAGRRR